MEEDTAIGQGSRVSVALLASILGVLLAAGFGAARGAWYAAQWTSSIDTHLESIDARLGLASANRWSSRDMARWVEHFRELNPDLRVPEAQENE